MNPRNKAWLWVLLLVAICGGAVGSIIWYRTRPLTPGAMLNRLSIQDSMVLYVDFTSLRRAGLMDRIFGSKTPEDPDYRAFVEKSGFNFREHLGSVMVAFAPRAKYMLVNGRFDWEKLREYVEKKGGKCYLLNCDMAGSEPERRISFMPVRTNVMALAVSPQVGAVQRLVFRNVDETSEPEVPNAPIWLSVPGAALQSGAYLPSGTRMFARIIEQAERVVFALAVEEGHLVAKMEVQCQTEWEAKNITDNLTVATITMRDMLVRDGLHPNAKDLSGVLAGGTFRVSGLRATGTWPLADAFVENVLDGGVN